MFDYKRRIGSASLFPTNQYERGSGNPMQPAPRFNSMGGRLAVDMFNVDSSGQRISNPMDGGYQFTSDNAPRGFRSPDFGRVGQDNPQYRTPVNPLQPSTAPPQQQSPPLRNVGPPQSQYANENAPRSFRSPDFGRVGQDNPQYRTPVQAQPPAVQNPMAPQQVFGDVRMTDQQQNPRGASGSWGPPQNSRGASGSWAVPQPPAPQFHGAPQNPMVKPEWSNPQLNPNLLVGMNSFGPTAGMSAGMQSIRNQQIDNEQYAQSGITRGLQPGQLTLEQATQHLQGYAPPRDTPQFTPNERAMQQATRPSPLDGNNSLGGAYSSSQAGMQSQALNPMMQDIRPENRAGAAGLVNGYNGMVGAMNDPNRLTPDDVYNSQGTGIAQIGAQRYGENDPTGMRGRMGVWAPKPEEQYGPVSKDANGRLLDGKISGDPRYATGMLLAAGRDPNRPQRGTPEDKAYLKQKWEQQQAKKQAFKDANGGLSPNQFRKQQTKDRISEFRRGGVAQSKPQNPMSPIQPGAPKTPDNMAASQAGLNAMVAGSADGSLPPNATVAAMGATPEDMSVGKVNGGLYDHYTAGGAMSVQSLRDLRDFAGAHAGSVRPGDNKDPFTQSQGYGYHTFSAGGNSARFAPLWKELSEIPQDAPDSDFLDWEGKYKKLMENIKTNTTSREGQQQAFPVGP